MYFIIFSLSFQYGAKIKRICFSLATPQSTLSTAPLNGSLICFSLRRGGTQCRSGGFVQDNDLNAHFFSHPSVDFVDSSPLWEPYMPLLEERCPKGGVVASYRTASRRHFSALPWATDGRPYNRIPPLLSVFPRHPQSTLSTAPLYGSLICLSLRRGAQRAEWWFRTGHHLDGTFQHYHGRPMVAPTTVLHLCSPFSLATPQSTSSTAPLYGSLICLSLRRGAQRAEWWLRTGQ